MNDSLIHDVSTALARVLVEVVHNCLRPEERRDCFDTFYEACKAGLESYELQRAGITDRLKPTNN